VDVHALSGRSPNPLSAEEQRIVGRGLAPAEKHLYEIKNGRPMVAPTMKMLLVKTKRREQAPALRYEIDFSAKDA